MQTTNNSSASSIFLKSRVYSIKDHRSLVSKDRKDRGIQSAPITVFFQDSSKFICIFLDYIPNETILSFKTRIIHQTGNNDLHSPIRTQIFNILYRDGSVYPDVKSGEYSNDTSVKDGNGEFFLVPVMPKRIRKSTSYSSNCSAIHEDTINRRKNTYNLKVKIDGIEYKQKYFSDNPLSVLLSGAMYVKSQKNITPAENFYNFYVKQDELIRADSKKTFSFYLSNVRVQDDKELYEDGILEVLIEVKDLVELNLIFPNGKKMIMKVNPLCSLSRLINTFHSSVGANYDLYINNSTCSLSLEKQISELESATLIAKPKTTSLEEYGDLDDTEMVFEGDELEDNEEMEYRVKFNSNKGPLKEGTLTYTKQMFCLTESKKSMVFNLKKGNGYQTFSGNDVAEISQDNCNEKFVINLINNKGKVEILNIVTESVEIKNRIIGKLLLQNK